MNLIQRNLYRQGHTMDKCGPTFCKTMFHHFSCLVNKCNG